jgi:hypothetical protein
MKSKEVRIADLSYFASRGLPFTDGRSPRSLRPLYAFWRSVHAIGARATRKLRGLSKGVVTLSPRKSASAKLIASRYRAPMRIDIAAVLAGSAIARHAPRSPNR